MTPDETRRRACLSLFITLIVLFDGFILVLGQFIDLNVDIQPKPLDVLRAQMTLVAAWLIFGTGHVAWRMIWSGIGLSVLVMLAMKHRADTNFAYPLHDMATLSLLSDFAAILPCIVIFMTQRKITGLQLVHEKASASENAPLRFRLRDMLLIVAACALVAFLVRNVMNHHYPRFPPTFGQSPGLLSLGPGQLAGMVFDGMIPGLFMAPCALVVMRPTRKAWLWAIYFIVICAVEPWIYLILSAPFLKAVIPPNETAMSILRSTVPVVVDNTWWYGVGLLPTMIVFLLLRGAGIRVISVKKSLV